MVQFDLLPSTLPPLLSSNPRDKSSPSGPGVGNCLKRSSPGGREVWEIYKISYLLLDFAKYPSVCVISRAVFTLAVDLKTTYF